MLRRKDIGLWQSVTGSCLPHESFVETALRELAEETGLTDSHGTLTDTGRENEYDIIEPWRSRYAPDVSRNREHVFHFEVSDFAREIFIQPAEHTDYRWMSSSDAAAAAFSETNRNEILVIARAGSAGE